jgi:hypothetical protein
MPALRPLALVALLLGASSAVAAPINVVNGESFLLAYGDGGSPVYQFKSTYGDLGPFTPGSFNLGAESSNVQFTGMGGSASATGASASSGTGISITGTTAASSVAGGQYVGQIAADDTGVVSNLFNFGYYLEFTLDSLTNLLLTVDGKTALNGDGAYADFGGILFDENGNQLYTLGSVGGSGTFSEQFSLGAGTYFLFAQSQSSVNGQGAANAGASFSVSLAAVAAVPEPLSVVAFGGLLAFGGLAVRRFRRA